MNCSIFSPGCCSQHLFWLVAVLKKVANAGASVLFTIHQPASEIFNAFDRLILMNKGRVMYQGLVEDVPSYFRERNHPLPKNYNPADWIMNVAQANTIKKLDKDGFFPKDTRDLPEPFEKGMEGKDELGITLTEHHLAGDFDERPPSILVQIRMLFEREIKNIRRDTAAVGARFGLTIVLGLLIGLIFQDVGKTDRTQPQNLNSTFGALLMVLLMSMFGTAQPALLAFPEERPVFLREYSTNHYSVISYFSARFTMEAFVTGLQILVQLLITYWLIGFQSSFGMLYVTVYSLAMSSTALSVLLGKRRWSNDKILKTLPSHLIRLFLSKHRMFCRGPEAWAGDASTSVRTTDAFCRVLCGTRFDSRLAEVRDSLLHVPLSSP